MRIAFLADPLDQQYGGIHVYTKQLLKALSKVDKKNEYIVIRSESKNEFEGVEEVVVPYLSFPGYRFWRLFFQLPKILVNKGVDIVVEPAHFGPFNLPKSIKRITVIHDMTVFLYPELHVFLSQYLQRKLFPRILKKSNHIITNSSNTTDDVVKYFPFVKNKISSILLGKDKSFKPRSDKNILENYSVEQPYILFVGTLEPRKNIPVLIEAFDEFKQKTGMAHQLVLIGKKGWKSKDIFKAINGSPFVTDIVSLGYVPKEDLPIIYSMAEVFVYPSIYEGFGLPILEAMACGTPVITSKTSSMPEVGGSAVMYADPNSSAEIAKKIISLCSSSEMREKFSKLGLTQSAQFSWEKSAKENIKIFEHLH